MQREDDLSFSDVGGKNANESFPCVRHIRASNFDLAAGDSHLPTLECNDRSSAHNVAFTDPGIVNAGTINNSVGSQMDCTKSIEAPCGNITSLPVCVAKLSERRECTNTCNRTAAKRHSENLTPCVGQQSTLLRKPMSGSEADETGSFSRLSGFDTLPNEILWHIISYLPVGFVADVLPCVSMRFRTLVADQSLWRRRLLSRWPALLPTPPIDWLECCREREQHWIAFSGSWDDKPVTPDSFSNVATSTLLALSLKNVTSTFQDDSAQAFASTSKNKVHSPPTLLSHADSHAAGSSALVKEMGGCRCIGVFQGGLGKAPDVLADGARVARKSDLSRMDVGDQACDSAKDSDTLFENQFGVRRSSQGRGGMRLLCVKDAHIAAVHALKFIENGCVCVSGGRDHQIKVWSLSSDAVSLRQQFLQAHEGWIWSLEQMDTGTLVSSSFDHTVKTWDLERATHVDTFRFSTAVPSLACTAEQRALLACGTLDHKVHLQDLRMRPTDRPSKVFGYHRNIVLALAMDDKVIISGSKDGTMAIFDIRAEKVAQAIKLKGYPTAISYNSSESRARVGRSQAWIGTSRGYVACIDSRALPVSVDLVVQKRVSDRSVLSVTHSWGSVLLAAGDDRLILLQPTRAVSSITRQTVRAGVTKASMYGRTICASGASGELLVWQPWDS